MLYVLIIVCSVKNYNFAGGISLLSGLSEWTGEYITNHKSCGTLMMTTYGEHGGTTSGPVLVDPFQKCF